MRESSWRTLDFIGVTAEFKPISLVETKQVSLMDRVDTKFIFHRSALKGILRQALDHYRILEIETQRTLAYTNQYFDTGDRRFYSEHHNGKMNRTKVRVRKYDDSDLNFLEIKRKDNKGRTKKIRRGIDTFETDLSEASKSFVNAQMGADLILFPTLRNTFHRITLVNYHLSERVTIDIDLNFESQGEEMGFETLAIAEIKQARFDRNSPFYQILRSNGINPYRISKYCVGVASLSPDLKKNNFKEKLMRINKITAA